MSQISEARPALEAQRSTARRTKRGRDAEERGSFEDALQVASQKPAYWPDRPLWSSLLDAGPLSSKFVGFSALSTSGAPLPGRQLLRAIRGFDQTNPAEYESAAQARTWGLATCSAAALTAVLRAAGRDVRIADVMKAMPGGLTPQRGLVSRPALVRAAAAFGATAVDDVVGYEGLRQATAAGQPVLASFTNRVFPQGHWVVVTGVTDEGVNVADSSRYDLTFIPRDEWLSSWNGRGIRVDGLAPAAPAEELPASGDTQAA